MISLNEIQALDADWILVRVSYLVGRTNEGPSSMWDRRRVRISTVYAPAGPPQSAAPSLLHSFITTLPLFALDPGARFHSSFKSQDNRKRRRLLGSLSWPDTQHRR
jgi:hypothetical protein